MPSQIGHRIGFIIQDMISVGLAAAGCTTEDQQSLQSRISIEVQDMDALGRSCSGETALVVKSMDDSYDFYRPLSSSFGREPPATAKRPPAKPDPQASETIPH